MAVLVFGAGATRGAEFVKGKVCKPPLNSDFFTQLQKISNQKHVETIKNSIKDAVTLFGKNFNITMEDFFTQTEFYLKVLPVAKAQKNFQP